MKVNPETISVLSAPEGRDLTLVLGGYRIVLTREEARGLADILGDALGTERSADNAAVSNAAIAAKVAEQVISWAQISEAVSPRK
jgi:hypothetical protein